MLKVVLILLYWRKIIQRNYKYLILNITVSTCVKIYKFNRETLIKIYDNVCILKLGLNVLFLRQYRNAVSSYIFISISILVFFLL